MCSFCVDTVTSEIQIGFSLMPRGYFVWIIHNVLHSLCARECVFVKELWSSVKIILANRSRLRAKSDLKSDLCFRVNSASA